MKLKENTKCFICIDCGVLLINNCQKDFHAKQYQKGHREHKSFIWKGSMWKEVK